MKSQVTVGVRVRPPLDREMEEGKQGKIFNNCIAVRDDTKIYVSLEDKPVLINENQDLPENVALYKFDNTLAPETTQQEVYDKLVKPAVKNVL